MLQVEILEERNVPSHFNPLHMRPLLSFGFPATPQDVRALYNYTGHYQGEGQTIAIVDAYHDPFLRASVNYFDALYHLPPVDLHVSFHKHTPYNPGWGQEEALDVEWAHALAPKARILVIEARSDQDPDFSVAIGAARRVPYVSVISVSAGEPDKFASHAFDNFLKPYKHNKSLLLVASGDDGGVGGASYPSDTPWSVGVGGVENDGGVIGGWIYGGGGVSHLYSGTPSPLISGLADDLFFVDLGTGGLQDAGGTSFSCPALAGIMAGLDQERAAHGLAPLTSRQQIIAMQAGFVDVLPNSYGTSSSLTFPVTPGYDLVTGEGYPNVSKLESVVLGV